MKLRLGPLPNTDVVKLTITVSVVVKERLDQYAKAHSEVWGEEVRSTELIPHILETFLRGDRAFKRMMALRKERHGS
jgi:hypothetical protein